MAHLNVREKRIEATIAYVGPELAGKATNFTELARDQRAGRASTLKATELPVGKLLKLGYRPYASGKVEDCEVALELVAAHGQTPASVQGELAQSADGVVFVVDSDPAALARTRAALDALREILREQRARGRPVVVQLNKRDLPHALSPSELVASLELGDLPTVLASAAKGDGVASTLSRVIEGLGGALKAPLPPMAAVQPPRSEGNPLLSSLRKLLQETVAEHVEALGKQLRDQIDERLAPVEHLLKAAAENACLDGEEAARARACLDALKDRANEHRDALRVLTTSLDTLTRDLRGKKARGGS
jgi:signal recognition particle receptor subunit beta